MTSEQINIIKTDIEYSMKAIKNEINWIWILEESK
jgi:hypothetical protein